MNIDELNISVRAFNCLRGGGVEDIETLCQKSAQELLEIPNLGVVSLNEIALALSEKHLSIPGYILNTSINAAITHAEIRTQVLTYWGCAISSHRHVTEEGASDCISKLRGTRKKSNSMRDAHITNAVLNGGKLCISAVEHGLSKDRIRQIVFARCRRINRKAYIDLGYPTLGQLRLHKAEFIESRSND